MNRHQTWLRSVFRLQVEGRLAVLTAHGFVGPAFTEGRWGVGATFVGPDCAIDVDYLEGREPGIAAHVWPADRSVRAGLSCLYVEAGLGPVQDLGARPVSQHSLVKAVGQAATAIEALLPVLDQPLRRRALLKKCGRHAGPIAERPPPYAPPPSSA